uniref:Uncharacterized protein n=1 Tax=Magallana gigas TaxID=29159 RepID=A0A8W8HZ40_MAGGI
MSTQSIKTPSLFQRGCIIHYIKQLTKNEGCFGSVGRPRICLLCSGWRLRNNHPYNHNFCHKIKTLQESIGKGKTCCTFTACVTINILGNAFRKGNTGEEFCDWMYVAYSSTYLVNTCRQFIKQNEGSFGSVGYGQTYARPYTGKAVGISGGGGSEIIIICIIIFVIIAVIAPVLIGSLVSSNEALWDSVGKK